MIEGNIVFAFSFRASESPCHPHQFVACYAVAKNSDELSRLFFLRHDYAAPRACE